MEPHQGPSLWRPPRSGCRLRDRCRGIGLAAPAVTLRKSEQKPKGSRGMNECHPDCLVFFHTPPWSKDLWLLLCRRTEPAYLKDEDTYLSRCRADSEFSARCIWYHKRLVALTSTNVSRWRWCHADPYVPSHPRARAKNHLGLNLELGYYILWFLRYSPPFDLPLSLKKKKEKALTTQLFPRTPSHLRAFVTHQLQPRGTGTLLCRIRSQCSLLDRLRARVVTHLAWLTLTWDSRWQQDPRKLKQNNSADFGDTSQYSESSKVQRSKWKRAGAASIKNWVRCCSRLEQKRKSRREPQWQFGE